jgi:hypothetical protein
MQQLNMTLTNNSLQLQLTGVLCKGALDFLGVPHVLQADLLVDALFVAGGWVDPGIGTEGGGQSRWGHEAQKSVPVGALWQPGGQRVASNTSAAAAAALPALVIHTSGSSQSATHLHTYGFSFIPIATEMEVPAVLVLRT